ncbi:MAG: pyruvate kinase [Methanomicrobiales archaeon]|nr:pyruvate kinase [Methanomicrobiales archaeon]
MVSMELPDHKTKIVCTIGPASSSLPVLRRMLRSGMNVARLNLSHGSFDDHRGYIRTIRTAAEADRLPFTILADLPGPKIRIGRLASEPILLRKGDRVILTTEPLLGDTNRIPVDFEAFPEIVSPGSIVYLADGFLQLRVLEVTGMDVVCEVLIGGHLFSRKGMNLVGDFPRIGALTPRDIECLRFGLGEGLDTFSISFIEDAADIRRAREIAADLGKSIRVVAKIERHEALENLDALLREADGVMIARGDLGVQIPLQDVPGVQKRIIRQANILGKPVITATQMLESMTENIRPTRAEVTDVATAILDGTDAVMLSEETSVGRYPVETVATMAAIARSAEAYRSSALGPCDLEGYFRSGMGRQGITVGDVVSLNVIEAMHALGIRFVVTPTRTGGTPRRISRFKPDAWILAFSRSEETQRFLNLSYGVYPFLIHTGREPWHDLIIQFLKQSGLVHAGDRVLLTEGVSPGEPGTDSLTIYRVP